MKFYEWTIVALLVAVVIGAAARAGRCKAWCAAGLSAACVVIALHLALGHGRWQMVPAYATLVVLLLTAASLRRRQWRGRLASSRRLRIGLAVAATILLSLTPLASWFFPMAEWPAPSGRFAVGTSQLHLIDRSRGEMHTANPLDHRELMVRAWYPAQIDAEHEPAPYWLHASAIASAINEDSWPLGWIVSHLGSVPTHSFLDPPLADGTQKYPVLVFSHGLGIGYAAQNTPLMEELASRGYVVFAIDHTYDGLASVLPEGNVSLFLRDAYKPPPPEPAPDLTAAAARISNSTDMQEVTAFIERVRREQPQESQLGRYWIDVWSQDQRFVMDEIEALERAPPPNRFAGRLDVTRIGVFGMSFGGISAAATCSADERCKAGINMDGFVTAALETAPQRAPFMYFANDSLNLNLLFMERDSAQRYYVKVAGARHLDFTDLPLLAPIAKRVGMSGTIDTPHMIRLMNDYVGAFFDRHLLGRSSPALEALAQQYPQVWFISRGPAGSP